MRKLSNMEYTKFQQGTSDRLKETEQIWRKKGIDRHYNFHKQCKEIKRGRKYSFIKSIGSHFSTKTKITDIPSFLFLQAGDVNEDLVKRLLPVS